MSTEPELIGLVRQLIDAENEAGVGGRAKADQLLAQNFHVITRMDGTEENRDQLLDAITNPKNPDVLREPDEREFWAPPVSGNLGVVRSVIVTKSRSNLQVVTGRFRNTHVFERQKGRWWCVAWQVTKLA